MKKAIAILLFLLPMRLSAENRIYDPQVKSLQAVVNQDWLSPAIMRLHGNDHLHVSFDELSHDYHRYIYRLEHCEADWTSSEELFDTDWLEGFNDNVIEDFEHSINTTVAYTHYQLTIPNDKCRLKMSGNYRLHVIDEDQDEEILTVEFMITEQAMNLSMAISTNTDIDTNLCHQQVSFGLKYGSLSVTDPQEQLQTVVMQNSREDNWRWNVRPSAVSQNGLEWNHRKELIFDGGNEYRKFEVLDPSHPTMGIDRISWDGEYFQAFPFVCEPRPNYLYDEDANGSFYIRNSDNRENDITSDYVWVNYRLKSPYMTEGSVVIDGRWTTEAPETYVMEYDEANKLYTTSILQKLGYYSYQYLWVTDNNMTHPLPSEGNFYQTENRYQVLVYYKGIGERTWRLATFGQNTIR
ncbi:MAG: DUF5103 domain-containing protein [Prevotella sp.]|nr:DUF5103 domain-containing protein [Prevotella sp.]